MKIVLMIIIVALSISNGIGKQQEGNASKLQIDSLMMLVSDSANLDLYMLQNACAANIALVMDLGYTVAFKFRHIYSGDRRWDFVDEYRTVKSTEPTDFFVEFHLLFSMQNLGFYGKDNIHKSGMSATEKSYRKKRSLGNKIYAVETVYLLVPPKESGKKILSKLERKMDQAKLSLDYSFPKCTLVHEAIFTKQKEVKKLEI